MNGKTARKLLMRGRSRNFWGRRAYLTVRVPVSLVPTPMPEPVRFEGFREGPFAGSWKSLDDSEYITISRVATGRDPHDTTFGYMRPWQPVYFANRDHVGAVGADYESWSYWTGTRTKTVGTDVNEEPLQERSALDERTVGLHKAHQEWLDRLQLEGLHPVLDALVISGYAAKSVHYEVKGQNILVTFGVKWFYPDTKLRFASGLGRAFRLAKRMGIPIRVIQ